MATRTRTAIRRPLNGGARSAMRQPSARDTETTQHLMAGFARAQGTRTVAPALDGAGRARLMGALQRGYGNAAVQRLIAAQPTPTVQRGKVFHDSRATLTWKDFKGKIDPTSGFDAVTFKGRTGLGISWTVKPENGSYQVEATIQESSLNLRAFMNPSKSWSKKDKRDAQLLSHEQGHFDIEDVLVEKGEVAIRAAAKGAVGTGSAKKKKDAVKQAVADLKTTAPFTKLALTDQVADKAQTDYDEDPVKGTAHGTKAKEQAQWTKDIAAGLKAYPIA